jgi:quinone-modifying oxidoreductase, subunit QmoA
MFMTVNAKPILIIGGGIGGMTAAVDAAEVGHDVILVEKEAYLGGRVVRLHKYFPKMCPPTCGFEINVRRIRQNPRIIVHTLATVEEVSGKSGDFRIRIKIRPRYVKGENALDVSMLEGLTSVRPNDFNLGMDSTKAVYLPHDMAYPPGFVVDRKILSDSDAAKLNEICPPGSIDLEMKERDIEVDASSIIVATGWKPYDANKLDNLGFGSAPNVITNVMMERLAAKGGPTSGEIVRPSDGKYPANIAFVQCAGSRDENHLPYCSAVCCMGSLKHARYIREKDKDAKITIFYIDIRTIGREEKFYQDLLDDENINFIKGKVARISEDPQSKNLTLDVQDTMSRENIHPNFDMVVLATGMVPSTADDKLPIDLIYDEYGFLEGTESVPGVFSTGCAKRPCDVSRTTKDSCGAAIKAIQCINKGE